MQSARAFREVAAGQENERLGKRLEEEIYVASEASATPLRNYAPQSNFSASRCVSLPWTSGIQMLSSPEFLLPSSTLQAVHPSSETPASTSFQADFHHDAGRSHPYGQCDPRTRNGRRRKGKIRSSRAADGRRRYRHRAVHAI